MGPINGSEAFSGSIDTTTSPGLHTADSDCFGA